MERAFQLHQAGRLAEAEAAYRKVLAGDPDNIGVLHLLGVLSLQLGRHAEAERLIRHSLALDPSNVAARNNLGLVLVARGDMEPALACFRDALASRPDYVDALINLAAAQLRQGDDAQAEACLVRAIELAPENPAALAGLGRVLRSQGRLEESADCHRRAVALQPQSAASKVNLGNVLRDLGRVEEAVASYREALALDSGLPEAHANLGNALYDIGEAAGAIECHRRALELRPEFAESHLGLGNDLMAVGELADAESALRRALALQPALVPARVSLAHLRLLLGDYESGLPLYESRFEMPAVTPEFAGLGVRLALAKGMPRWNGEDAGGKSLAVWTEQGLGDSLMVMRYLPLLKRRGVGRLVVYCDAELVRVMQTVAAVDEVISRTRQPVAELADLQCPAMSLPLVLGTTLETIPRSVPYLAVPASEADAWRRKFAGVDRPRVGLAWAGGAANPKDAQRSVHLSQLDPLLEIRDIRFVSLQKGKSARQLCDRPRAVIDRMEECGDLLQTAALVEQLDLVICVDTAVAHLAGALGKSVWMLNRYESEWRWMLAREDSPWYPTMRIFRQSRRRDWEAVVLRMAEELRRFAAEFCRRG